MYVTLLVYVPEGAVVFTAMPYHTVEASLEAVVAVVFKVSGDAVAGIAANFAAPIAVFDVAVVGPAPNPPTPSIRYPQLLAVSAIGVVWLPVLATILLPPDTSALDADVSPSFKVYPAASLVLTVTVSLAIVCTPLPVGIALMLTVPLEVSRLMTEPRVDETVVEVVSALTVSEVASSPSNATLVIIPILSVCFFSIIVYFALTLTYLSKAQAI